MCVQQVAGVQSTVNHAIVVTDGCHQNMCTVARKAEYSTYGQRLIRRNLDHQSSSTCIYVPGLIGYSPDTANRVLESTGIAHCAMPRTNSSLQASSNRMSYKTSSKRPISNSHDFFLNTNGLNHICPVAFNAFTA